MSSVSEQVVSRMNDDWSAGGGSGAVASGFNAYYQDAGRLYGAAQSRYRMLLQRLPKARDEGIKTSSLTCTSRMDWEVELGEERNSEKSLQRLA